MWLFRNVLALFLVVVVSSSAITTTSAPPTGTPTPAEESPVVASASVGEVETPAIVTEVDDDWEADDAFIEDEEEEEVTDEDEEDDYSDGKTREGFEANVPKPIHAKRDIYVDKDNLVPILRTVILAYTHKEHPSYSELLKAAGVSAFKTSLNYIGKEKLAANLLHAAKKLTNIFDDDERDNATAKVLGELAEEYLAHHRFKLVMPQSLLLHRKEMEEFLATQTVVEGRGLEDRELDIAMARADPAVTTVLSIGPLTWMALIGGMFSIPYFLYDDGPSPARVDHPTRNPSPHLLPPGLPFFNVQHLRRDENEQPHPLQQLDPEQAEYQQRYAEWYNQWYLRYKNYYDENFPDLREAHIENQQQLVQQQQQQPLQRPHPQPQQPLQRPHPQPQQPLQRPPPQPQQPVQRPPPPQQQPLQRPPPQQQPLQRPPQQQPLHRPPPQQQQQGSHPQQVLAFRQQHPRVRPQRPVPHAQQRPHAFQQARRPSIDVMQPPPPPPGPEASRPIHPHQRQPVKQQARQRPGQQQQQTPDAEGARITVSSEDTSNTFGTFQEDVKQGDSHFKVFRGVDSANPATLTSARPRITPSPQPVYVPTTESSLQTESGFKPIIRAESSVAAPEANPGFRPPKQDTVLAKNPPQPRRQTGHVATAGQTITTGFQPLAGQSESSPPKKHIESTTRKVSSVTSKVFATTPPPAVFFRTATQKSVRVVTSSSVVLPSASSSQGSAGLSAELPELKRPQRHQQSEPSVQELSSKVPQPQALVASKEPEQQEVVVSASTGTDAGFIRTNIPANIRIIDHEKKTVEVHTTTKAPTTSSVSVYALDPFYGSRLSRIDVIFHQLGMADEGCREQIVCNIYKNPDAFTPFSDFLSRQLTVNYDELQRPKVSDERILRFFRYLRSAKDGQDGSDCQVKYPDCTVDTTTLSHQPIMKAFEKVSILRNAAG